MESNKVTLEQKGAHASLLTLFFDEDFEILIDNSYSQ